MCRALANGDHVIVTRFTGAGDLCMIDQRTHRYPGRVNMAGFAQIGGGNVRRALAR